MLPYIQVICENPDRDTTGKKLEEIRAEIESLASVEENLDAKLEMRKKQFHVMIHSIQELQRLLDEDNGNGSASGSGRADLSQRTSSLDTSNVSSTQGEEMET